MCRGLCSVGKQESRPPGVGPHQSPRRPDRDSFVQCLVNLGLTESQAEQVYERVTKTHVKHDMSALTALAALGLNSSSIVKVLEKCPELLSLRAPEIQQRVGNLRKLGLLEGSLQRMVSHYPHILTVPVKRVNMVARFLREKCLFTVQQLTDILRDSPVVVEEDLQRLEYKFQYAYFRMGTRQAEMVKARLFRVSLEELRCRHCFLERRGLYQTPDKKGQTLILNPKLKDVLCVSEETFLSQVAKATQEELDVFWKLTVREMAEEVEEGREEEPSSDEEEDDEEKEEDDEKKHKWNTGYNRRKR
ncbi:transcription termination factor 4, mitochondrial [Chanos chanos]|uniref:Transcription termination factor 4, mitochondrial n=1 Tax=Chanos chanos TaxID=29144 RepID=A0A6J2VK13_CHACN|nr:transcription termination factor 4, mitochondrial [Chanos chanos]